MTATEIRAQVDLRSIRMADVAIHMARRALTGNTGWNDVKRHPYNLPEVEMAGEILFYMFNSCVADIKQALINMPEEMDGCLSLCSKNYFDVFVECLDRQIRVRQYDKPNWQFDDPDWPKEAAPRKPDWALEGH